jgi:SAM-dependent methyltransferase
MRKALLKLAKDRFLEMQSTHQTQNDSDSQLAATISPTPHLIIETFLPHLRLDSSKLLVDLGCGDGRWLLAASKLTQCRSFGIDLDEDRLKIANQIISEQNLDNRIDVQRRDVFDFVKSDSNIFFLADVFVVYLFRDAMVELGKLLQERLCHQKKSVRVLSVGFAMTDWTPTHEQRINGVRVYLYNTNFNAK